MEWTDDLSIPLPPGRTVADLVEFVLQATLQGTPAEQIDRQLTTEFGSSADDGELARDRSLGGLVRAATGNPRNCPPQDKDPVAWESFQRGTRDPSMVARIYPTSAPRRSVPALHQRQPSTGHEVGHGSLTATVAGCHRRGMQLDLAALEAGLDGIRRSPQDHGTVELIVGRPAENERSVLAEGRLDVVEGLVGDGWRDRGGDPGRQITVMNARAVALLAQARDRWPLAGDQLYVDLDLSAGNLPPGTRLEIGTAVLEVTELPHRGCKKFAARFGLDALRFVNSTEGYALKLRGINTRVVRGGVVRPGDPVRKLRPAESSAEQGTQRGEAVPLLP
jgi:MOSC domain-containing protein YiiM